MFLNHSRKQQKPLQHSGPADAQGSLGDSDDCAPKGSIRYNQPWPGTAIPSDSPVFYIGRPRDAHASPRFADDYPVLAAYDGEDVSINENQELHGSTIRTPIRTEQPRRPTIILPGGAARGSPALVSRETHSAYDRPPECGWKVGTVSRETDQTHTHRSEADPRQPSSCFT
jgi:hypothetical protein